MIPIRDENPRVVFPVVTLALILINTIVFLYQVTLPAPEAQNFVFLYGAVPNSIFHGNGLYTIFTSMFLHGGILHILGNMWFLWLFGDNVEGLTGHFCFLIFYLLCGVAAFLTHFLLQPTSTLPMIGASGAISGVLGAYALRYPKARIHLLVPLFPFIWLWRVFRVPAVFVLGGWFLLQIVSVVMVHNGGVAWFAHIGGFIFGLLMIRFFEKPALS
jgi:membrane associated rhomboid family serine protease